MRKPFGASDAFPDAPRGYGRGFKRSDRPTVQSLSSYSGVRYPRKDWRELMNLQDELKSSPWHHWKSSKIAVKNQKRSSWCWCFGVTGCIQNRYGQQGMGDVSLSASSVAGPIMNYNQDRGGWGQYAVEYIQEHGIAQTSSWPELAGNERYESSPAILNNRRQFDICGFESHDAHDLDSVVSALICPVDPRPVTIGLLYMGHLMFANRARFIDGQISLTAINSWGPDWNGDGTIDLVGESRCSPDEAISISCVKPVSIGA